MIEKITSNVECSILLSLALLLFSGFLLTRITKLCRLPNVTGFILAGVLIGPYAFNLIPSSIVSNMSFVSDIALSFIAFDVGRFFTYSVIKSTGKKVMVITLFESLLSGIVVCLAMHYIFSLSWNFSLLVGAMATATAPASTMMTIKQYKAKGEFIDTLLQVVALDDVICLFAYSITAAFVSAEIDGYVGIKHIILPILFNLFALALGFMCGFALKHLLSKPTRSSDNRLILTLCMLLALSGICALIDVSPLLSCMLFGASYINLSKDTELFDQLNGFSPPLMSIFFIVSGMNLDISALKSVGIIGVAYFIIRIAGKYIGAYIGSSLVKSPKAIRNYLGMALIPQAGVAIGLAFLGQRILPYESGNLLLTIILSSSVLYELIGPACAKAALKLSKTI